jgi:hypothetical protein
MRTLEMAELYFNWIVAQIEDVKISSPSKPGSFASVLIILLLGVFCFSGCNTSTVASRRKERTAAYTALPPEDRALVDQGQIKIGMTEDAVYIAWGKPQEVLQSEDARGRQVVWLYHGNYAEEQSYWNYRIVNGGSQQYLERYLDRDFDFRTYVSSEIVFESGRIKSWRTLPRPH